MGKTEWRRRIEMELELTWNWCDWSTRRHHHHQCHVLELELTKYGWVELRWWIADWKSRREREIDKKKFYVNLLRQLRLPFHMMTLMHYTMSSTSIADPSQGMIADRADEDETIVNEWGGDQSKSQFKRLPEWHGQTDSWQSFSHFLLLQLLSYSF